MFTRKVLLFQDPESEYWVVECPSLPGCVSQGKTREEALENIKEAIELYIEVLIEDDRPIPVDTVETVPVTVCLYSKLEDGYPGSVRAMRTSRVPFRHA